MQARSSTSGNLIPWMSDKPDFAGASFPGPGSAEHIAVVGGRKDVKPPLYMPNDSHSLLRWRFQQSASPYLNEGTLGSAYNMVAESGDGTVYRGGQPDGHFGLGLKFSMADFATNAVLSAISLTWPTTRFSCAIWVTLTRILGQGNIGRIFYKSVAPEPSWSTPFTGISFRYDTNVHGDNTLAAGIRDTSDGSSGGTWDDDSGLLTLQRPHLIGLTHGDGVCNTYLDGQLSSSSVVTLAFKLGTGKWRIGDAPNGSKETCGMIIHDIHISDVVRPASWWKENWRRGRGGRL